METKFYCECCGRELDPAKKVELELDQRIGEHHDFGGVPEDLSQGWFDFGPDCAKKARAKARKAIDRIAK
jgi:hypothetical protein